MNALKHYFYRLFTLTLLVFAMAGIAGAGPLGVPFKERSLALGLQFDTVRVQCGTNFQPSCLREDSFSDPAERPFLLHYVTLSGSASMQCSFMATVQRELADDTVRVHLGRLSLLGAPWYNFSTESTVITFPVPLRGEAGDKLGIWRFPEVAPATDPNLGEACRVFAVFGIEYLKKGHHRRY